MNTSENTITIPSYWTQPKYSLGQRIKQGIIVGIQYRLPDGFLAEFSDGSWRYIVQVNTSTKNKEVEDLEENEVQPLSAEDLHRQITAEIEAYQRKIAALTQQLAVN